MPVRLTQVPQHPSIFARNRHFYLGLTNPTALYTFSMQQGYGNGQISGAVPEPATMGLFGLG
jgi:hypothetical protein